MVIKREVLLSAPGTMDSAIVRAISVEGVDRILSRDDGHVKSGKRPAPRVKNKSADVAAAEGMADDAAGLTSAEPTPSNSDKDAAKTQGFEEFYKAMGPDVVENVDVDELVRRFTAWQLYSQVYTEPEKLKATVLKTSAAKNDPLAGGGRSGSAVSIL